MPKLTYDGSLSIYTEDTSTAKPAVVPIRFEFTYSQKAMLDLNYPTAVTNQVIGLGTITAPRLVLVEVVSGALTLSTAVGGTGPVTLTSNESPPPDDSPRYMWYTFDPETTSLYATTLVPTVARVWAFA
jgi:hypothetical protein